MGKIIKRGEKRDTWIKGPERPINCLWERKECKKFSTNRSADQQGYGKTEHKQTFMAYKDAQKKRQVPRFHGPWSQATSPCPACA